jgi:hypothetical protein
MIKERDIIRLKREVIGKKKILKHNELIHNSASRLSSGGELKKISENIKNTKEHILKMQITIEEMEINHEFQKIKSQLKKK